MTKYYALIIQWEKGKLCLLRYCQSVYGLLCIQQLFNISKQIVTPYISAFQCNKSEINIMKTSKPLWCPAAVNLLVTTPEVWQLSSPTLSDMSIYCTDLVPIVICAPTEWTEFIITWKCRLLNGSETAILGSASGTSLRWFKQSG